MPPQSHWFSGSHSGTTPVPGVILTFQWYVLLAYINYRFDEENDIGMTFGTEKKRMNLNYKKERRGLSTNFEQYLFIIYTYSSPDRHYRVGDENKKKMSNVHSWLLAKKYVFFINCKTPQPVILWLIFSRVHALNGVHCARVQSQVAAADQYNIEFSFISILFWPINLYCARIHPISHNYYYHYNNEYERWKRKFSDWIEKKKCDWN